MYAGARYYMPAIPRWTAVDPLADLYHSHSPYNYVMGDPISLIDPNGKEPCPYESDQECGIILDEVVVERDRYDIMTDPLVFEPVFGGGFDGPVGAYLNAFNNQYFSTTPHTGIYVRDPYLGDYYSVRNLAQPIAGAPPGFLGGPKGMPRFGPLATSKNYRAIFFRAYPELKGKVVVHHAVEQQVLRRYPGLFSEAEIHSLSNLRGIPRNVNSTVHLSKIRKEWNSFYRNNPDATRQQVLNFAQGVDAKYGHLFRPPVK